MATTVARALRQETYRKIVLDAAEVVFAEHGFDDARMQAIATIAGLSVGTIYDVIGGKSPLFAAVLGRRLPAILEAARAAAATATTAVEHLVLGMHAYVDFMLAHPNWMRIHLHAHPWGLGPATSGAQLQYDAWQVGMDLHTSVLAQAMQDGTVLPSNPQLLARSLAAIQQVHLADWVATGMKCPPGQVREAIVQLFCQSFLTDEGRRRTKRQRP